MYKYVQLKVFGILLLGFPFVVVRVLRKKKRSGIRISNWRYTFVVRGK